MDADQPAVLNVLSTVPATTFWTETRRSGAEEIHHELTFLDFAVDGVPLRELAVAQTAGFDGAREMTRLCQEWPWPVDAVAGLSRLLAREATEDFDDGRVALLVCPVCADVGCQALSARVVFDHDTVAWQELGWQSSYELFAAVAGPAQDGFDSSPSFRFDRHAYLALLKPLLTEFQQSSRAETSRYPAKSRWRRLLRS